MYQVFVCVVIINHPGANVLKNDEEDYVMMETFIVLGLCFILYEALDLFQSCYNNNRHQNQQHLSHNQNNNNNNNNSIFESSGGGGDNNGDENHYHHKDTARLILDTIQESDNNSIIEEDNLSSSSSTHQLDNTSKVFLISENVECHKIGA